MTSRRQRRNRMRINLEGDVISSLPDDLIAKILSFIGTKQAVETSVLSSRWEFIWTKLPCLNFSSEDFSTLRKFHKFFTNVLSSCNNQAEISLNLHGKVNQVFVQRILNQARSRNLQQLTFTFLHENRPEFPLSLFSSQSLKHLTLIGHVKNDLITPISMWELPALTTLHLEFIILYDDDTDKCVGLFSKCTNLKNLTIKRCRMRGSDSITICHPQLSNLTLDHKWCPNVVNVVAPRLKYLTIISWDGELRISAPDLTSMLYENYSFQLVLDTDSFPSLEKVDLCICYLDKGDAHRVVDLLQKFSHVKFLTLSLEITELLPVEAIAHQPSPFVNLRSLKILPQSYHAPDETKLTMSTEIKNYLLDASPQAIFTMVTREEIRATRDTKSAQNLMEELRVLLDQEKEQIEKKEKDKRPQQGMNMPLNMGRRVAQVRSYWEDLNDEIKQGERKTSDIISLVQRIQDLLTGLPTSNRAELQPHLSSLCMEAESTVSKILNCVRIGFDTKESSLSVSFHQLFAAAQSSS